MRDEKTAKEIMEEVCADICDKICKFRDIYSPTNIDMIDDDYFGRLMSEQCERCPLKRLI